MSESRLKVIDGGKAEEPVETPAAKAKRKARRRTAPSLKQWECRFCLAETGIATRVLVQTRTAPFEEGLTGRFSGGHKGWACLYCLMRGTHTPATA